MPLIELPRVLEDYFAHAETAPTRAGRRFTITLPYLDGERLDRLQWWWQVPSAREALGGDDLFAQLRAEAVARFRRHIERWLENTRQRLHGDGPIPSIAPSELPVAPLPEVQVANG